MTQEEKQLLLVDLCARLPYDVIVCPYEKESFSSKLELVFIKNGVAKCNLEKIANIDIEKCKPYLRPMSSMTEEERKELTELIFVSEPTSYGYLIESILFAASSANVIDWLNSHHFDYRGLIEKGLAIEAKEGMY